MSSDRFGIKLQTFFVIIEFFFLILDFAFFKIASFKIGIFKIGRRFREQDFFLESAVNVSFLIEFFLYWILHFALFKIGFFENRPKSMSSDGFGIKLQTFFF